MHTLSGHSMRDKTHTKAAKTYLLPLRSIAALHGRGFASKSNQQSILPRRPNSQTVDGTNHLFQYHYLNFYHLS
jgi:hypothetical protein